jgi:hypothetical protein
MRSWKKERKMKGIHKSNYDLSISNGREWKKNLKILTNTMEKK